MRCGKPVGLTLVLLFTGGAALAFDPFEPVPPGAPGEEASAVAAPEQDVFLEPLDAESDPAVEPPPDVALAASGLFYWQPVTDARQCVNYEVVQVRDQRTHPPTQKNIPVAAVRPCAGRFTNQFLILNLNGTPWDGVSSSFVYIRPSFAGLCLTIPASAPGFGVASNVVTFEPCLSFSDPTNVETTRQVFQIDLLPNGGAILRNYYRQNVSGPSAPVECVERRPPYVNNVYVPCTNLLYWTFRRVP